MKEEINKCIIFLDGKVECRVEDRIYDFNSSSHTL